jgi:hypothetical protein
MKYDSIICLFICVCHLYCINAATGWKTDLQYNDNDDDDNNNNNNFLVRFQISRISSLFEGKK